MSKNKNGKKKFKKRYVVLPVLGVIVVGVALMNVFAPKPVLKVETEEASKQDLKETLDISGMLQSGKTQAVFAETNAAVKECNVSEGQEVHAGDILLTFDTTQLEADYKKAELEGKASEYSYKESLSKGDESVSKQQEAAAQVADLKDKIEAKKNEIAALENAQGGQNLMEEAMQAAGGSSEATKKQQELTQLEAELSKQEGIVETAKAAVLSDTQKKQLDASNQASQLMVSSAKDMLDRANRGISAAFDGVVTDLTAVAGGYATQGVQLFMLRSNKDMVLEVSLSKYELEKVTLGQSATVTFAGNSYNGTVTKIGNSAQVTMSQNGNSSNPTVKMEIKLDAPNNKLVIGMEGKANILIAEKKDVVTVPVEAVNTDKKGDFCFVLKDGKVMRQEVKTGISSSEKTEILSGISEKDKVIVSTTEDVKDGKEAVEK